MDAPDVLLDAGCGAQHLPAVLPDAFEHHLHGVLERGEDGTANENELISVTFGPSQHTFPFLLSQSTCDFTTPTDKSAHWECVLPISQTMKLYCSKLPPPAPCPAVDLEWQWGSCLWVSGWETGGYGLPRFPFYLATGGRGYISPPKTTSSGGISRA